MKQKYLIIKDDEKNDLILREFAELDKDILSLLCEEVYESSAVETAIEKGRDAIFQLIKTRNLYPPKVYLEQLVSAVETIYNSKKPQTIEILINDADFFVKIPKETEIIDSIEEESNAIDSLLEDTEDMDDKFGTADPLSNIGANSSIKIADDESLDVEDDG